MDIYLFKFFGGFFGFFPSTFIILNYSSTAGRVIIYLQTTSSIKVEADS